MLIKKCYKVGPVPDAHYLVTFQAYITALYDESGKFLSVDHLAPKQIDVKDLQEMKQAQG